jgi:beta-galactosidase
MRAEALGDKIRLVNTLDFTDISEYLTLRLTTLVNGYEIESFECDAPSIAPRREGEIKLPENADAVKVEYILKKDIPLVAAGAVMGYDMLEINEPEITAEKGAGELGIKESQTEIVVKGENFSYGFDKRKGIFNSLEYGSKRFAEKPLEWNIWRAPTDNDMFLRKEWEDNGYDRATVRAHDVSYEMFRDEKKQYNDTEYEYVSIRAKVTVAAVALQWILHLDVEWRVYGNGVIGLDVKAKKNPENPFLPRFGIRLFMNESFNEAEYFGFGPYESYEDKHEASYRARFNSSVYDMHEDYIKPQENGSHRGCVFAEVSGFNSALRIAGKEFSFNVSGYTQEELTKKKHNFELEPSGYTVVCADYRQNGIGTNSCGPRAAEEFMLNKDFEWSIELDFGISE